MYAFVIKKIMGGIFYFIFLAIEIPGNFVCQK